MSKQFQTLAWAAFLIIVAGAIYYAVTRSDTPGSSATAGSGGSGQGAQPVEILKYSDYSCPSCKQYIPFQEALEDEFGDLVSIEYRHFPLGSFPHSDLAARAVEAAAEQGEKEGMHDMIFDGQAEWSNGPAEEIFLSYAEELGLDIDQFRSDLESDEVRQRVLRDRAEGERRMVRATPTFFINGQRVQQNPRDYQQFKALVEMHMYR